MTINSRLAKLERTVGGQAAPTSAVEMTDGQLWDVIERSPLARGRRLRDLPDDQVDAVLEAIAKGEGQ